MSKILVVTTGFTYSEVLELIKIFGRDELTGWEDSEKSKEKLDGNSVYLISGAIVFWGSLKKSKLAAY